MGAKVTFTVFVSRAQACWGDSQFEYFEETWCGVNSKTTMRCTFHDEVFSQIAGRHLERKPGCLKCKSEQRSNVRTCSFLDFLSRSRKVHGDRFQYDESSYTRLRAYVNIICPVHGVFSQWADNHVRGSGCSKCDRESRQGVRAGSNVGLNKFLQRVKAKHGDEYTVVEDSFIGMAFAVKAICKNHGSFTPIANHFVRGQRCPGCVRSRSYGEQAVHDFLELRGIEFQEQWSPVDLRRKKGEGSGRGLRYDFTLPSHRVIIEFDGPQHYRPIQMYDKTWADAVESFNRQQARDRKKDKWAADNGWLMVRVTEISRIAKDLSFLTQGA